MSRKQAEIQEAKKFLRVAFKKGPRLAKDVMRESIIYGIPDWAIAKACQQLKASGWLSQDGLMWGFRKL